MLLSFGMEEMFSTEFLEFLEANWLLVLLVAIWTVIWKGLALWKSAQLSHKWWFIIILLVNTVGLLEIIYIFLVANRYSVSVVEEKEKPKTSSSEK